MDDFTVIVKLDAVQADITELRNKVQAAFNSPITVKFNTGDVAKTTKQSSATSSVVAAVSAQKALGQSYDVSAKKSRAETAEINKQAASMRLMNAQRAQAKRLVTDEVAAREKAMRAENAFMRVKRQADTFYWKNRENIGEIDGARSDWRQAISKYGDPSKWTSATEAQNDFLKRQAQYINQGVTGQTKIQKANIQSQIATDYNKLASQAQNYYEQHARGIEKNAELSAKWASMRKQLDDPKTAQTGNIKKSREDMSALIRETEKAGAHIETVGQKLSRLFGAHFDTALVMFALHALQQALVQVYQNVVQLDGAMVDLQIASGMSRDDVRGLMTTYNQMAKELGATTLEMAQGADSWIRQGKSIEETNLLLTNSTMLSKLGQIDAAQSSEYLTSIMKGYNIEAENSIDIVDKLTAVDMAAATSAGDIATALAETSVSARIAGLSLDKLIGQVAVIGEVTQDKNLSPYAVMHIANPLNCWKPLTCSRGQSAAKLILYKKVQRPSRKRVHASAWKWWVSDLSDNDMVCAI